MRGYHQFSFWIPVLWTAQKNPVLHTFEFFELYNFSLLSLLLISCLDRLEREDNTSLLVWFGTKVIETKIQHYTFLELGQIYNYMQFLKLFFSHFNFYCYFYKLFTSNDIGTLKHNHLK